MPQNRGLIAGLRLSGYDVVASAAIGARFGFRRLDQATRREIDWALDQVGARDLARRSIAELSGGERQRLLLSQALLGRPRLLLLDEPLISLDPAHQRSVVEIARRLRDELEDRHRVQRPRTQPAGQRDRPGALSRRRRGGARPGRRGRHRAGAVAALWLGDRGRARQGPLSS